MQGSPGKKHLVRVIHPPDPPAKHRAGGCTLGTLGRGAVIPDGQGVGGGHRLFKAGGGGRLPVSSYQQ